MTERERVVNVLRAMEKAASELDEVAGMSGVHRNAYDLMCKIETARNDIIDDYNNSGHPEVDPIRDEEWKTS